MVPISTGLLIQNGNRFSMNQIQVMEEWCGEKRFHRLPVITFLLQFEPEFVCYVILECLSPDNAFQVILGIETLPLRMRQNCSNAERVVDFLEDHPKVERVIYPKNYDGVVGKRAERYFNGGFGALVGLELKGGIEAGKKFIDSLKLFYHVANIGDARSLAIHPATTTHSQLTPEEQLATGVTPGYVRLSLGIKHPDDLLSDLKQALEA